MLIFTLALLLLAAPLGLAQEVIHVGGGSYASYPPAHEGGNPASMLTRTIYVTDPGAKPVPTNDWWTDMLVSQYAGQMWAYPLTISADANSLNVYYPVIFVASGTQMELGTPLEIAGLVDPSAKDGASGDKAYTDPFSAVDARASDWSDWLVRFQLAQSATKKMDVTMGHGLPCTWVEFTGVQPQLNSPANTRYFTESGDFTTFPITRDHLGLEFQGRRYGVFAPDATQFARTAQGLQVTFAGAGTYLVIAALPTDADLATLYQYAYAKPLSTQMDWSYDTVAGQVQTTWTLTSEALKGTNTTVLQGWLPHHYRNTANDLAFNGIEYRTPRGVVKCAPGNTSTITYAFNGVLPNLPAPYAAGLANDFDGSRMRNYVAAYSTITDYGDETYFGGKALLRFAKYMMFGAELGYPEFEDLRNTLRGALVDWFTYTDGETEHYYAMYPNWPGLVGFNESFYSFEFTDHHFHYGYHVIAAALLGMYDQEFLDTYGDMIKFVAKEYANWDRNDTSLPFMRTFDIWNGHSYAGGLSSPGGNNQESSSEAMNSWAALFLFGAVTGDDDMRAAGAMGWTMESEAVNEYWFNYPAYLDGAENGNFSPLYTRNVVGILFDYGQVFATYFSADPAWIYGIQWLPMAPWMCYLVEDPAFSQRQFDLMMADRDIWVGGSAQNTFSQMGSDLGNLVLEYVQLFDPGTVVAEMDALWAAGDPIATENYMGGVTYYFSHANRLLGPIQWNMHTSIPTSRVFYNAGRDEYSYVVYNPGYHFRLAEVFDDGASQGFVLCPPRKLTKATELLTIASGFSVSATLPADAAIDIDWATTQIAVLFSQQPNPATLAGTTIAGPGVTGITYVETQDNLVAVFDIVGDLQSGESYTVTIPASAAAQSSGQTLGAAYAFTFVVAEQTPEPDDYVAAHYMLDETSGTQALDASGREMHGVYQNSPTLGVAGAAAATTTAVQFDGVDDYVTLPPVFDLGLRGNFTVTAWVNLTSTAGERPIVGTDGITPGNALQLSITNGRPHLGFYLNDTTSDTTLTTYQWYHLAYRFYEGEQAIFVDGSLDTATTGHENFKGLDTCLIGRSWGDSGTPNRFSGRIDDVQIYSRALTDAEIATLYENPGQTNTDGLQNFPPQVDAGPGQVLQFPESASLNGVVTDDGLPLSPGEVTTMWSLVDGPAAVLIDDVASLYTAVDFVAAGTYRFRLTASDGDMADYDDVLITLLVSSDLIAHYQLDETSGSLAMDTGGYDLHGTFESGLTLGQPGAASGTGTSVLFAGGTSQISLGTPALFNQLVNDFTISAWVYPTALGGTQNIFGANWPDFTGWSLRLVGSELALERLGPTQLYQSGAALTAGDWTHIAACYGDDNDVTFYVDGIAVATIPGDQPATPAVQPWYLGNNGSSEGFKGRIDDVQLYKRALRSDEIAYIFAHPGETAAMGCDILPDPDPTCDGIMTFDDIPAFVLALIDQPAYTATYPTCCRESADRNHDGSVDGRDIEAFVDEFLVP